MVENKCVRGAVLKNSYKAYCPPMPNGTSQFTQNQIPKGRWKEKRSL